MSSELTTTSGNSLAEQMQWCKAASVAGILPAAYKGKPADMLVAVGFGQSMGLSPSESLYRINVIQGKPTMSAELISAQVRKAGHKLRIKKDEKNQSVTVQIVRADDPEWPFEVTRDKKWAAEMGLSGKDNYKKQPMTMLTWRAITACAREACPEALFGVAYTPDEMHDLDTMPSDDEVTVTEVITNEEPVDAVAEPVIHVDKATSAQAEKITHIMQDAGVSSRDQAEYVFKQLVNCEGLTDAKQLNRSDAEMLLSVPSLLRQRTQNALTAMGDKANVQ